ncbi:unnamed protein product, partial [Mesorhabditis belari]|uniref:tRNA pseudouridine synthase n=1 Tax=Mesorhabditis belari TaxID=2138241 RepID=A0AAF3J2R8_9BILA
MKVARKISSSLQEEPKKKKKCKARNLPDDFHARHPRRKIAFAFYYYGWEYDGLVQQNNTDNTVEKYLMDALLKTKLVEEWSTCEFTRCGRTDKRVSAFRQVAACVVRSSNPNGEGVFWTDETSNSTIESYKSTQELPYVKMLNGCLPQSIRVMCWAPVAQSFNARHSCTKRTYKYSMPRSNLDFESMRSAGSLLVGEHDFRNFCQIDMNADRVAMSYVRTIYRVELEIIGDSTDKLSLIELTIDGSGFLWHMIRYIVTVLHEVGCGHEKPEVISSLLDVTSNPARPQYGLAADSPLCLFDCAYDKDHLNWIYDEQQSQRNLFSLQKEWATLRTKARMLENMMEKVANEEFSIEEETTSRGLNEFTQAHPWQKNYTPIMKLQKCARTLMSKNLITGYFGNSVSASPTLSKPLFSVKKRKQALKTSFARVGNDSRQLVLDAGQKEIGLTQCHTCGMAYSIDRPKDVRAHQLFHDQANVVLLSPRFSIDKAKRITKHWFVAGIHIIYINKSVKDLRGPFEDIVENFANKEVGFCESLTVWGDEVGRFGCMAIQARENGTQFKVLGIGIFDLLEEAFWETTGTSHSSMKLLGVNRIWVHKHERGKGIASTLLGTARRWAIHGMTFERNQIAFSEPTDNGRALAQKYCRFSDDDILIYQLKKNLFQCLLMSDSIPPPKPPRGVFAEVQEKIEVFRFKDEANISESKEAKSAKKSQFSSTDLMMRIVNDFREQIRESNDDSFTSEQAIVQILKYLDDHKEDFPNSNRDRESAMNLLNLLMRMNVFSCSEGLSSFVDSKKCHYTLLPVENFNVLGRQAPPFPMMPTPAQARTPSVSPSRGRKASFKGFFRGGIQWGSKSKDKSERDNVSEVTFSSEENISTVDALYYKVALNRLLLLVEVENLEGIANPNESDNKTEDNVSYLTSILSKMGFAASRSFRKPRNLFAEEETDECISQNMIAKNHLLAFFNTARILVPSIHLKRELPNNPIEECSLWTSQCLHAICTWLNDLTHGGQNPLIPVEFAGVCKAVIDQVLLDDRRWKHEQKCLQYLVIMIPAVMRKHLIAMIHWLSATRGTRAHCILGQFNQRAPPLANKRVAFCDNAEIALQRVTNFILPAELGTYKQHILIKAFVALFNDNLMGVVPREIEETVANQELNAELEDAPVVQFCQVQSQQHDDCTQKELVKMMHTLLESPALTAQEKHQKLKAFQQSYALLKMALVPDQYWKTLLMEATAMSSGETASQIKPMSDEDRKWLEQVMAGIVDETDIGRRLERALKGLKMLAAKSELSEEDEEKIEELALQLEDLIQFADLTTYFIREQGLEVIERFLHYKNSTAIQLLFAQMILTFAENNPPAQDAIVSTGFLQRLLNILADDKTNESLQLKLLGAISGAVRSNVSAFNSFLSSNGSTTFSTLISAQNVSLRVAAKAARILTSIAFTLMDNGASKVLNNDITRNYIILIEKDMAGEASSELDYIREYLLQFVEWEDLDEGTKDQLVKTFKAELNVPAVHQDEFSALRRLIQKFSQHKCG